VTAVAPGSATITATVEGINATAAITVANVPVAAVSVSPASAALPIGGTQQLTAAARSAAGAALTGRIVTWSSSAPGVANVSASGLVTAVTTGSVTITATVEGIQGTATMTVSSNVLTLGQTVTGLSSSAGDLLYNVTIPAGTSSLSIRTSGGSGTVRLLVYQGASAAGSAVCSSSNSGSTSQLCAVNAPAAGTWTIRIQEYVSAFNGVTLEVNPPISTLSLGQTVTGLSSSVGDALYNVTVPAGTSSLTIRTSGGSGTVRLLVYQGASAAGSAVCSSNSGSTSQLCAVNAPAAGTWTIRIQEYVSAFTGVTLTVSTP
jgi:serine protease